MPFIRSAAEIAKKWGSVTPARTPDYEFGVKNPKKDWAAEAGAAESRYEEGIAAAVADKRFGKGVAEAGTEKWSKGAAEKGVARWGPGVTIAQPDYEAGFAPYREVIAATDLPPRYPKGDPRNIERVSAMAAALHAKKVGE